MAGTSAAATTTGLVPQAQKTAEIIAYTPIFDWRDAEVHVIGFMRGKLFQLPEDVKDTALFVPDARCITEDVAHLQDTFFMLSNQLLIAREDMQKAGAFVDCKHLVVGETNLQTRLQQFVDAVPPEDKEKAGAAALAKVTGPRHSVWLRLRRLRPGATVREGTQRAGAAPKTDAEEDGATESDVETESDTEVTEEPRPVKRRTGQKVYLSPHGGSDC